VPRPNLLFFIPDQLRYDALGCSGNALARTPHVDGLASRGTRFTDCYGQHSVCGPSRVSFLTGWYPHVRGHRTLDYLLHDDEPNLLRILLQAGYHVAHAGMRGDTFAPGMTQESTSRFGFEVKHLLEQAGYPYDLKAKLQNDDPVSVGRVFTIRTKTHTYVRRLYEDDELYDRQADPGELENLSGRPENAELEAELRTRLLDLIMETGDVIPWKGDGRFDAIGAVVPKA
jgi:hypothetical protein